MEPASRSHRTSPPARRQWLALGVFLLAALAVMAFGGLFSPGEDWYGQLRKPPFTPPGWVFPVVWPILYVLMAVAAWAVWRRRGLGLAVGLWIAQLLLNAAWSPAFFGLRSPVAGLVVILALWLTLAATTVVFWRASRPAGLAMLPYLLWTTFAAVLNAAIVYLNA